jgi:hypothetical protein
MGKVAEAISKDFQSISSVNGGFAPAYRQAGTARGFREM